MQKSKENEAKEDEAVKKILVETAEKRAWAKELRSRVGKFYVSRFLLEDNPKEVMSVMSQCIILRAEHLLHADQVEYIACSMEFEPIVEGSVIPEYVWEITTEKFVAIKQICVTSQSAGATTPHKEHKEAGVDKP